MVVSPPILRFLPVIFLIMITDQTNVCSVPLITVKAVFILSEERTTKPNNSTLLR